MTPEQFRLMEAVYDEAAGMDAGQRTRFIEERCAGDDELRRELLAAFRDPGSGLTVVVGQAAGAAAAAAVEADQSWSGRRVGPYRIVRLLGRGGMGAVFLALRDDDQFHKEVAIKTLKFELEGGPAVARFRHERQILARLEHPNIARLLDGGTTEQGTPYIVLEYVVGSPIDSWCEEHKLSIEERLRLFRQVCDVVQYAHQHLVVHRDLKPGNILVTSDSVPKLLDFGIAKLLDDGDTGVEPRTATATGALLMTPDFASPEQVRGQAVSTATDVYSLGAVLYLLLSGRAPHALETYDAVEIARVVCESEIRPPSAHGNRRLRGDLDVIVLKAMQKDPARRYASVAALSDDILRSLEGRPISARRDATLYRAMKFVRRHYIGVAAALAVVLSLGAGVAVSLHEARVAQRRFGQVRELANKFLFQFYDQVTPLPGSTAVRASMVETARTYLDGLSKEAGRDRELILELAQAYQRLGDVEARTGTANLGQVDEARRSYQSAVDLYGRLGVGPGSPPDLRVRLGRALWAQTRLEFNIERYAPAETAARRMLNLLLATDPDPEVRRWRALAEKSVGDIRLKEGRGAEGVGLLESAKGDLTRLQSSGYGGAALSADLSDIRFRLARARASTGDLDGALTEFLALLQGSDKCNELEPSGKPCRDRAVFLTWAADLYADAGRPNLGEPEKAAPLYERAVHISERMAALDANDRQMRFDLAARYGRLGDAVWREDPRRALDLYERALSTGRALASKEQFEALHGSYLSAIARPLIQLRRFGEARKLMVKNLADAKAEANNSYADLIGDLQERSSWAMLLIAEGKRGEAQPFLEELIRDTDAVRTAHSQDLMPTFLVSRSCRMLASISAGPQRRDALLRSAAAWRAWPPTTFTRREEQRDLDAANR